MCAYFNPLSLDLHALELRLYHRFKWPQLKINICSKNYKRFLYLLQQYPHENFTPSEQIDDMWHYHILDTQQYHADCDKIFGKYMHHIPGNGALQSEYVEGFQRFYALYEKVFHEKLYDWQFSMKDVALHFKSFVKRKCF